MREVENAADKRTEGVVARMQSKIDGKDDELREADKYAATLRQQIRNQEALISRIPYKLRDELVNKIKQERGAEK